MMINNSKRQWVSLLDDLSAVGATVKPDIVAIQECDYWDSDNLDIPFNMTLIGQTECKFATISMHGTGALVRYAHTTM